MATTLPHVVHSARAKLLDRGLPALDTVPAQEATVARLLRKALHVSGCEQTDMADACDVGHSKVSRWIRGECTPGLIHLARLAQSKPGLCEAILRGLQDLYPTRTHIARPLPDRICSVMAEVGDLAREIHLALADGQVDEQERARIRKELGEARAELDRLERDLG